MGPDLASRSSGPAAGGLPNQLGVKGWWSGGRWGIERYLYTLHRLTGIGLVLYLIAHILVTSTRALGQASWEASMARVSGPVFEIGEFAVFAAFALHGLNGIRLILVELGVAVGRPIEPVYPYKTSVGRQRPLAIVAMLAAGVAIIAGGMDFFFLH